MKKFLTLTLIISIISILAKAQETQESYTSLSNGYNYHLSDFNVVREIKGGTVFLVEFEDYERGEDKIIWAENMKGAFLYACKIWEEVLPTMLPIRISVSIDSFRTTPRSNKECSKVKTTMYRKDGHLYSLVGMKDIIFQEYNNGKIATFTDYSDYVMLDTCDIRIVYNKDYMNTDSLSFSIGSQPENKYDFVTIALKDIAKGLGFCSHFIPLTTQEGREIELLPYDFQYNGLDRVIRKAFGDISGREAYNRATSGSFDVHISGYGTLSLYAPTTWNQNTSLNMLIPREGAGLSNILGVEIKKGTVIRNIEDNYKQLFNNGFDWVGDLVVSVNDQKRMVSCTSDNTIPYRGEITMPAVSPLLQNEDDTVLHTSMFNIFDTPDPNEHYGGEIQDYCVAFDPNLSPSGETKGDGWTFSLLKKDGTWDIISHNSDISHDFWLDLSTAIFHYDDEAYARTTDNKLRGRLSRYKGEVFQVSPGYNIRYCQGRSYYLVLDYLPQKPQVKITRTSEVDDTWGEYYSDIDVTMRNLEGVTSAYVDQLEEWDYYPVRTYLTDPQKGSFSTIVDNEYETVVMVTYRNQNGYKTSDRMIVSPIVEASYNLTITDNTLSITYGHKNKPLDSCTFVMTKIADSKTITLKSKPIQKKMLNGKIDISELTRGTYVMTITHPSGKTKSLKFTKS